MTFKVGDKVRRVASLTRFKGMGVGDEDIVVGYITTGPDLGLHLAKFGKGHTLDYFVLVEAAKPATTPHKWAKEIKAWADGAEIECRYMGVSGWGVWVSLKHADPKWHTSTEYEYRVKPEKKPDVVGYMRATLPVSSCLSAAIDEGAISYCTLRKSGGDNIQCTFDGETGKLKAVQLLSN